MKKFTLICLLCVSTAFAQEATNRSFNVKKGLALKGYDPVAYFTENKPVLGSKEYRYEHLGVTYYFSSAANRTLFKANPAKYEPQYGAWCAYALIKKPKKMRTNPKAFKITAGKLYLFYNSALLDKKWNAGDEQSQIKAADRNYKLLEK